MNRRVVDLVSEANFVPTRRAARALAAEDVPEAKIHLTGNTVVDALLEIAGREGELRRGGPRPHHGAPPGELRRAPRAHRARHRPPRPDVSRRPGSSTSSTPTPTCGRAVRKNENLANVTLVEPLDYLELVRLMRRVAPDPHRLGRHPGRGADLRQARPRAAREDRAARRASRPAWRFSSAPTRSASSSEAGILLVRRRGPRGGWPAEPTRTATATPRTGSPPFCCGRPVRALRAAAMRPAWESGLRGRLYDLGRRAIPLSWRRALRRRAEPGKAARNPQASRRDRLVARSIRGRRGPAGPTSWCFRSSPGPTGASARSSSPKRSRAGGRRVFYGSLARLGRAGGAGGRWRRASPCSRSPACGARTPSTAPRRARALDRPARGPRAGAGPVRSARGRPARPDPFWAPARRGG